MNETESQVGLAPVAIILIVVAVFVAIIGSFFFGGSESLTDTEAPSSLELSISSEYPNLWVQANLPEYPNATVVKKRQGQNLSDGVQVTLETQDNISTVVTYYNSEMTDRGFAFPTSLSGTDLSHYGVYTNGDKRLSLTVTKNEDSSTYKIHAVYGE